MKLLVVLSVIACGYAAKLDRTYLPPASAASAGGSPGSLSAPSVQSRPSEGQEFGQTHGSNAGFLNAPLAASRPSEGRPGYAQPEAIKSSNAAFGNEYQAPSGQFNQPGAPNFDSGFKQPAQSFGNQAQNYQRNQPERARASEDRNAQILRTDSQNDGETFSYNFETSNGIAAEESGVATNGVQAQGVFSYSDDDGQTYRVAYTADENGYQPQGDHLPTPHPIPEEILKSIEENARAAASGTQEGAYNPEEDNKPVRAQQQYNSDAPTSYGQAPTGPSGAFNQPGKAPEPYTAPSFGALSRPQESQGNAQGPSQLYNTPEFQATPGFRRRQPNSPSKLYGAPSANNARPNQFQEASGRDSSNNFAPVAPSFGSSASSQGRPSQHQASPSNTFGRTQGFPQGQESDESGYQYNRPQGSAFSRIPSANQGQFNSPAIAQPSRVQNFRPGPSQGSFGSNGAQASRPQGFGAQGPQSSFGAARSPSGPSDQGVPSFPTGSFGVLSQPSFGPPSPAKPSQPSKFPQNGPAFGPSNGQILQKSQGHSQGMADGYEYNRPSSHGSVQRPQIGLNVARNVNGPRGGHSGDQNGFNAAQNGFNNVQSGPQQRGQSFGGPRQPPSFNENEGYKY